MLARSAACVLALGAFAQTPDPTSPESNSKTTSDTIAVALTQEAYDAWDGDMENPHFLFPGEAVPAQPQIRSTDWIYSSSYAQQIGSGTIIVANASCQVESHNPHAGEGPPPDKNLASKAKSSGRCSLTPTGNGPLPSPSDMLWVLLMKFQQDGSQVGGIVYGRTGFNPQWHQNPTDGYPGTQVFRYDHSCVDGSHNNRSEIYVVPPWPYVYNGPAPIEDADKSATIVGC